MLVGIGAAVVLVLAGGGFALFGHSGSHGGFALPSTVDGLVQVNTSTAQQVVSTELATLAKDGKYSKPLVGVYGPTSSDSAVTVIAQQLAPWTPNCKHRSSRTPPPLPTPWPF